MGSQSLLQWIFLTQEWDQDLKKLNKWLITFQSNRPRWIHWWINCAKCLRKKFTNYLQSLSEERREGILSNSFYEASISLVVKPDKNITRKDKYKMISPHESHSVISDSLQPHKLYSPWNSPGQNTGVGSLSLLQEIIPTQGSNPGLPHCRWILYQVTHKGSPRIPEWVAYPFSSGSSPPRNRTGASCIAGRFFTNWAIREIPQMQKHSIKHKLNSILKNYIPWPTGIYPRYAKLG